MVLLTSASFWCSFLSTITLNAWMKIAMHAEPDTVSCDIGCFAADLQRDMLQDLNWMIHWKNPLHGFFSTVCVGCNELRDRPESLFPQVSWIQGYEAFGPAVWRLCWAMGQGHDWAVSWVTERRRSHCVLPILTVLLVSLWQYTRDVIISWDLVCRDWNGVGCRFIEPFSLSQLTPQRELSDFCL